MRRFRKTIIYLFALYYNVRVLCIFIAMLDLYIFVNNAHKGCSKYIYNTKFKETIFASGPRFYSFFIKSNHSYCLIRNSSGQEWVVSKKYAYGINKIPICIDNVPELNRDGYFKFCFYFVFGE